MPSDGGDRTLAADFPRLPGTSALHPGNCLGEVQTTWVKYRAPGANTIARHPTTVSFVPNDPPARGADPPAVEVAPGHPAPSIWNIANALTILRIGLVPILGWLLLWHDGRDDAHRIGALVVFLAAIVTDKLDGVVARRRGLVTDFGKLADPIADKALTGMALVALSIIGELTWWVTVAILARELAITVLRFVVIRRGVIAASRGGKVKTFVQAVAISLYVQPSHGWLHEAAVAVMAAAVVVTILTGVDYVVHAVRRKATAAVDT